MTDDETKFYDMTPERERHLRDIKHWFLSDVDIKYRKGQAEHGDDLFKKANLIDDALEEVLDLAVYLFTLRDQIKNVQTKFDELYGQTNNNPPSSTDAISTPEHPAELGEDIQTPTD